MVSPVDAVGLKIRPADLMNPVDAHAIVSLLDAYAADPMGSGHGLSVPVRERLIPGLQAVPHHLILLGFLDGAPVGLVICFQGFSTFLAQPLLNVHDLAVLPNARRRGVGGALLAAVEAEARRRGCCKLTLEVREDNPGARRLYLRTGFTPGHSAGGQVQYHLLEKRLAD